MKIHNCIKVLHLIDDEKFTDFVIDKNSSINKINNHIISHTYLAYNQKYHYTQKNQEKLILKKKFKDYKNFISKANYDILVIHCLTQFKAFALSDNLNRFKKIIWCIWGTDFYHLPFIRFDNLYFPETRKIITNEKTLIKIKKLITPIYHKYKYGKTLNHSLKKVIKKVNYFAPIIKQEFEIAQNIPFFHGKYIRYSYGDLGSILGNFDINNYSIKKNIFIGNSATPESNHLDIFLKLKNIKLKDRKLIVPLSYGQTQTYGKTISDYGYDIFKNNFDNLKNFIPLKEYIKKISSCGFCIMNHTRQQGLGNALLFLMLGSKLFLSNRNPMYKFFKYHGIKVFSIESELTENELNNILEKKDIDRNRELVAFLYSENAINEVYKNFYSTITKDL